MLHYDRNDDLKSKPRVVVVIILQVYFQALPITPKTRFSERG